VAYLLLGSMPAAIVYWYLIHPLVDMWRRVGKAPTWLAMTALFVANLAAVWIWRDAVLVRDLGVYPWMWVPAAVLYGAAIVLELQCRKQLKFSTLAGSPELSALDGDRGIVLREGIYAHIRHPRYLSVMLGILGVAFFINYSNVWLGTALMLPALFGVVLLEERELVDRFGEEYADYARQVPRFVPGRRG
jgi:protein-S-isoprenylcysteine O-methyltransferase Ste14